MEQLRTNLYFSPIHTYNGYATLKRNLPNPHEHAIIYTSNKPPNPHWYQDDDGTRHVEKLKKDPIKVLSEQRGPDGDLDPRSRLNYGKVYTVEKDCRVLKVGMVENISDLLKNAIVKSSASSHRSRSDKSSHHSKDKAQGKKH
jgi:hypothetical protein